MKIWLVAGEDSGDQLGAKLMASLHEAAGRPVTFGGVGGEAMTARGLTSLFPLDDVAVMGYLPVLARLRTLLRRIRQTVDDVVANRPDVLVIIDSPGFTHAVASRVRKRAPEIPIVDYVSPSVWAWRPWRAASMRSFVDHVLALLPFEPEAHLRLNGPPCTYVGHPLIERFSELRPDAADAASREAVPWRVVVLPGSRRSEIERLMPVFGRTLARMARDVGPIEAVLPAVTRHRALIERMAKAWSAPVRIVAGEAEKYAAFRQARAALAASGTVTLELALAGVPMVIVPGGGDQWEIANRVVRQGSARLIRPLTADALTAAVADVLASSDYRSAARRARDGIESVADPVRVCHDALASPR